ncbi:polysaccharide deacetylase family protein [Methanoculleus sp. 7T]|uniref:polysaccharide deacetylase family protein n=1 Tax=Methanoculleus sp. 7T TaxID=2937282 RepID=UPI0020BE94C5|nr:polysaccharide deacetylase family protein [Methanoculleus sp. 7T]MCK8517541.1 polysaccharide deacetylase family protein [Methanoculleus sp. 7T]
MFHPNDTLQHIRQNKGLWDLYTRKEEYSPRQLDRYGRFLYAYSTNQDVLEPRVSKHLVDNGYEIEYPDGKQFAVCLTHDVDEIYPPRKHTLLSTLTCFKRLDFGGFKQQTFWKLHGKEKSPYWNFQGIMDLEEKYGARSSFYFLATDSDIRRFRYNIEDLEGELGRIVDRGWEVGLHGGYYAYNDLEEILREKERLEQVLGRRVTGYRNHYLRFCVPDSWEILEKAGFGYDTTLGYPDMVGFRNGMCHPFRPYNLRTDTEVSILEVPMIIMDGTLFDLVRSYDEAWEMTKRLIDTVADCQGVLTLNWHTNNFNCPFRGSWPRLYENTLEQCYRKGAWMASGNEVLRWWHYNGR